VIRPCITEEEEATEKKYKTLEDDIKRRLLDKRIVMFVGEVGRALAADVTRDLLYLATKSKKPIRVILNSIGGEVYAGLLIYNTIKSIVNQGTEVTVEARGLAASMATIILQAGSKRVAPRYTRFLIHEVSGWTWGKVSEVEEAAEEFRKVNNMLRNIIAERSGRDPKEIDKLWTKKEVWYSAEEAKEFGLIDEII